MGIFARLFNNYKHNKTKRSAYTNVESRISQAMAEHEFNKTGLDIANRSKSEVEKIRARSLIDGSIDLQAIDQSTRKATTALSLACDTIAKKYNLSDDQRTAMLAKFVVVNTPKDKLDDLVNFSQTAPIPAVPPVETMVTSASQAEAIAAAAPKPQLQGTKDGPPFVDLALEKNRFDALNHAIRSGGDAAFEALTSWIEAGGDIEWRGPNQWTLLHLAARFGNERLTDWLVKNGANVSARSNREETPLIMACDISNWGPILNPAIVRLLLENGADPDSENCDGRTALSSIFVYDDNPNVPKIVKLLVDHGAEQIPGKSVVCPDCGTPDSRKTRERNILANLNGVFAQCRCPKCQGFFRFPVDSINRSTGLRVRHPACGAIIYLPPDVWCTTCGGSLSTGWQTKVITAHGPLND